MMKSIATLFLTALYSTLIFSWDFYQYPEYVYRSGGYSEKQINFPRSLATRNNDDGTLTLNIDGYEFVFCTVNGCSEYTHENGIFVSHKEPQMANRAALFMDLAITPFGSGHLCSLYRGLGSPIGYYLNPVANETYKEVILYKSVLYEVSIVKAGKKLRITLVEKDEPENFFQVVYQAI